MLGQTAEALLILEQAIAAIERGGDLVVLWRALSNACAVSSRLGRMEEALRYMERALTIVERIGNPDQTSFVLGNLGSVLIGLGDWKAARVHLERALTLIGEERTPNSANALQRLGNLATNEGKWQEAATLLNEALVVSERTGDRQVFELIQSDLAELDILTGRPLEAIRRLEKWAAAEDVPPYAQSVLARALLETGAVERAAEIVTEALPSVRARQNRYELIDGLLVYGMVLMHQGWAEEAASAIDEGMELARSLPLPHGEAQFLFQLGLLQQQRGDAEQARARLEEALDIFQRLGAMKDVEQTEQEIAKLR